MTDKKTSKNTNKKQLNINIKNMGIDIDRNEYREIVLSQSNFPEKSFFDKKDF